MCSFLCALKTNNSSFLKNGFYLDLLNNSIWNLILQPLVILLLLDSFYSDTISVYHHIYQSHSFQTPFNSVTLNYIIYEIKIISLFLAVNHHHILCLKIEKVRQFSVVVTFNKSKITSSIYLIQHAHWKSSLKSRNIFLSICIIKKQFKWNESDLRRNRLCLFNNFLNINS